MNRQRYIRRPARRGGFTLIEIMVALAVMMLLMLIILVPVNMALNVFHIGKARNEVAMANRQVMADIVADLRRAVYVYPNAYTTGITDKKPYCLTLPAVPDNCRPYFQKNTGARVDNASRIDMVMPAYTNGVLDAPLKSSNYIVTYYARRMELDESKPFDPYSNPIVLYRAQYAYETDGGTSFSPYDAAETNNTNTRYSTGFTTPSYPGMVWLVQNEHQEPKLSDISEFTTDTKAASHTRVTPRDMAMTVNTENLNLSPPSYKPDSSFICDDSDSDGKIDRVTVSLSLIKYDDIGADTRNGIPYGQSMRLQTVVDLPNVK